MVGPDGGDPFRGMEPEVITEPIRTIDVVYEKIIDNARGQVTDLDWQEAGVSVGEASDVFDATYALSLRQAAYELPITLLVDNGRHEEGLLLSLPDHRKRLIKGQYWLGMTVDEIDPMFATFARDHLVISIPELIALKKFPEVPAEDILARVASGYEQGESSLGRAATRMHFFLQAFPGVMRSGYEYPQS